MASSMAHEWQPAAVINYRLTDILRPYITLILPAFNESATIVSTISKTITYFEDRGYSYQIIVAADGNDGTRERVAELGNANAAIQVIGHLERLGKGRGVREAVAMAAGEIIGYADADYKVPIEEFDKVAPLLKDFDVVTGSRALNRALIERRQPLYRRIGARGFAVFMRIVTGLREVTDSQCGFKFFHRHVALQLFRCQKVDGYMFDVEILALATLFGYRIKEVPIRWRDDGDSRLELVRGNLRNVRDIFRIRLWRRRYLEEIEKSPAPAGQL
jgi:dolichyl-phosphate beta-glucosyltransferase